jgi:hypoxanthine phosphoribosyltransferase
MMMKMTLKIGYQWHYTLCKVNKEEKTTRTPAATMEDIYKIVENAMTKLQASLIQSMYLMLKNNLDNVKEQVTNIETTVQSKSDIPQNKQLISEMLKHQVQNEVKQAIRTKA